MSAAPSAAMSRSFARLNGSVPYGKSATTRPPRRASSSTNAWRMRLLTGVLSPTMCTRCGGSRPGRAAQPRPSPARRFGYARLPMSVPEVPPREDESTEPEEAGSSALRSFLGLFVVPLLVVILCVAVFIGFGWIAYDRQTTVGLLERLPVVCGSRGGCRPLTSCRRSWSPIPRRWTRSRVPAPRCAGCSSEAEEPEMRQYLALVLGRTHDREAAAPARRGAQRSRTTRRASMPSWPWARWAIPARRRLERRARGSATRACARPRPSPWASSATAPPCRGSTAALDDARRRRAVERRPRPRPDEERRRRAGAGDDGGPPAAGAGAGHHPRAAGGCDDQRHSGAGRRRRSEGPAGFRPARPRRIRA